MNKILPTLLATITGESRYRPKLEWSSLWVSNIFRVYEQIFGRRYGIRAGMMQTLGHEHNFVFCYTYEDLLVQYEVKLRNLLKGFSVAPFKIYTPEVALPYGMSAFAPIGYKFAIATDVSMPGSLGTVGPGSTVTNSVTLTGSDLAFVSGWTGENGSAAYTGSTYAGAACTVADSYANVVPSAGFDRWRRLAYKLGASSGANNFVVSYSASHFVFGYAVSYTGVDSAGSVLTNKNAIAPGVGTSVTTTVSIVTDQSWLVAYAANDAQNTNAGTSTTVRGATDNSSTINMYDSGGAVGTGSQSLQETWSSSASGGSMIMMSMAPAGGGGGATFDPARFFPF